MLMLLLRCLLAAKSRNAAEGLARGQPWSAEVLVEVEDHLQGVAASQIGQGSCGLLKTD